MSMLITLLHQNTLPKSAKSLFGFFSLLGVKETLGFRQYCGQTFVHQPNSWRQNLQKSTLEPL
jgi:hypothetical protein